MNGARSEVPSGIGKFVSVMYELICRDAWRRPTPSFARARPNERNHSFIVRASAGSLSRLRTEDRNEVLAGIFDAAHGEATDRPRRSRYGLMPFGQFWNYPAHMPSQRRLGGAHADTPFAHISTSERDDGEALIGGNTVFGSQITGYTDADCAISSTTNRAPAMALYLAKAVRLLA